LSNIKGALINDNEDVKALKMSYKPLALFEMLMVMNEVLIQIFAVPV
jgi:hypothetical protein